MDADDGAGRILYISRLYIDITAAYFFMDVLWKISNSDIAFPKFVLTTFTIKIIISENCRDTTLAQKKEILSQSAKLWSLSSSSISTLTFLRHT